MCIVHKDFRGFRAKSPASFFGGNLIGLKPATPYDTIHSTLATIKKRMRNLTIILLFISLFACNQTTEKSDSQIEKFEKILGEQETIYLNEIVADFDNYLSSKYPDQKSKFKSYLTDISELKIKKYWEIDSAKLEQYRESNLFGEYDTVYPDSVWYDGLSFSIKYPDDEFIEEMVPIKRKGKNLNVDSTITSLKNEPRFILTEQSKLFIALDSINQSDSLIITYFDAKEAAGNLSPSILAGGIGYYLNDNNEYFAKRILIMEMYER